MKQEYQTPKIEVVEFEITEIMASGQDLECGND